MQRATFSPLSSIFFQLSLYISLFLLLFLYLSLSPPYLLSTILSSYTLYPLLFQVFTSSSCTPCPVTYQSLLATIDNSYHSYTCFNIFQRQATCSCHTCARMHAHTHPQCSYLVWVFAWYLLSLYLFRDLLSCIVLQLYSAPSSPYYTHHYRSIYSIYRYLHLCFDNFIFWLFYPFIICGHDDDLGVVIVFLLMHLILVYFASRNCA